MMKKGMKIIIEDSLLLFKQIIINNLLNNRNNYTEIIKEEEIDFYNNILNTIEKRFISDNYNTKDLDNGEEQIIKTEKMIITFTTIENQKNNINNNINYWKIIDEKYRIININIPILS